MSINAIDMNEIRSICNMAISRDVGNWLFTSIALRLVKHQKFEAVRFAFWYISKPSDWQYEMVNVPLNRHSKDWLRYKEN